MVRGIFSNLSYPFVFFFASTGFTATPLYPCTVDYTLDYTLATKVLTCLGFH